MRSKRSEAYSDLTVQTDAELTLQIEHSRRPSVSLCGSAATVPEIAHVHAPFGLAPAACAGRISEDRAPAWIRTNPRGARDERTRNGAGGSKAIAASLSGTRCSRLFAFTSLASMRICLRLSRVTSSRLWRLVLPATVVLDEVVGPSGPEPRAAHCSAPSLPRCGMTAFWRSEAIAL